MLLIRQRADGDCGIAALAMFSEMPYEDIYVAISRLGKDDLTRRARGKTGLNNVHIIRAARLIGIELTPTRAYDLDDDDGVLRLRWNNKPNDGGHFVAVRNGMIFCPTFNEALTWRDYLERYGARACTLLKGNV